ncbi:MAG: 50S ribosomal protein L9 [Bacilli bacterium]|nr:50S ribosomal protein L9 [Bacilli bacterium]
MEVILLQDVKKLGKKNEKVTVSDGYANNFLIKNRLAVPVSKKSIEILENQKEDARIAEENAKKEANLIKNKLAEITLEFQTKVGSNGKAFGSISLKQVEEELKAKYGIVVDKRKFVDKGNLDTVGYYKLRIELYKGIIGEIKVHISERKD